MRQEDPGLGERLRLTVITDRQLAEPRRWLAVVGQALEGGATCIQLRDKRATGRELLEMARALRPLVDHHRALFLVNDRFDIALAAGAHGVHLGDDDLLVAEVRRIVSRDFLIGGSADTTEAGLAAEDAGADYLGVGSVFGTSTKKEVEGEVIGAERLASVASAVSIPVVGIGGVTAENIDQIARAGAVGAAVISAVMGADDPRRAASDLLQSFGSQD
ncbi:MAG: thiamine phosphate synthase [Gemmatimonadota bacterium]|nr:thiamine phosphate synthase [Candidatus Palauibacterales bacterium]